MKRLSQVVLVTLLVATPLIAEDKPSIDSLIKALQSDDLNDRRDAAHALARVGPIAVGAIVELSVALEDRDKQVWIEATQALAHLGAAAEPAIGSLLKHADSRDEQRRYRTAYALGQIGRTAVPKLQEQLDHESSEVREVAVRALGWIGADAADAVPQLIHRLEDKDEIVRSCSIDTLGKIGPASVDKLIEALQSQASRRQVGAATALALIGAEASEANEVLSQLLENAEPPVQAAAIMALGRVGIDEESSIRPLAQALSSKESQVNQAALEALVRIQPKFRSSATEVLSDMLQNIEESQVAGRIALVLGSYGSNAGAAVRALLQASVEHPEIDALSEAVGRIGTAAIEPTIAALQENKITTTQVNHIVDGMPAQVKAALASESSNNNPLVREVATLTLVKLVPRPHDTLEKLTSLLNDDSSNVRRAAAVSMLELGEQAKAKLPSLLDASASEANASAQVAFIQTISHLQNDRNALIGYLAPLVSEEEPIRIAALKSLGDQAKLPASLHESLAKTVKDSDATVRAMSVRALVKTEGNRDQTAQLVVAALRDEDAQVREQALASVPELGKSASAALDVIAEQLVNESPRVRIAAIESLAELGAVSRPAFGRVTELYGDKDATVRLTVIKNVRKVEDAPGKLLPTLIKAVEDSEWEIRQQAAYELGEMEEDAAPAVPALLKMLRKDDESDAARQALREINTAGDEAVQPLLEIVKESSGRRSRYYALYLLRKMGPRAKPVLPELKRLRKEADGRMRDSFDRAIREIEDE